MIGGFRMPMGGGGRGLLDLIGAGGGLDQTPSLTKMQSRPQAQADSYRAYYLMNKDANMMTCPMCGGSGKVPTKRVPNVSGYR